MYTLIKINKHTLSLIIYEMVRDLFVFHLKDGSIFVKHEKIFFW